jgi:hypothetical protein
MQCNRLVYLQVVQHLCSNLNNTFKLIIDPIPPVVELPETPKFLPPGDFVIVEFPRERKGDSKVITGTGVIKEMPPPAQEIIKPVNQKPLVK